MIYLVCPGTKQEAASIVAAALRRSCGYSQVSVISASRWRSMLDRDQSMVCVVIDPLENWAELIIRTHNAHNAKLLVFGTLPPSLAHYLGAVVEPLSPDVQVGAKCDPAPIYSSTESPLHVVYRRPIGDIACPIPDRAFLRYDFSDEWNNLGFGAIRADGSVWAWSNMVRVRPQDSVADVTLGDTVVSDYAALWDTPLASLLWFNRSVGPVDSQEWRLIEVFLAHYRYTNLPCCPVLSEVPYGYAAAVTMRMDCDEDIESARPLWQVYAEMGVPFSLAIHTQVLADRRHYALPREVVARNGAVLSHTATHAQDWGGSYEAAFTEATMSAKAIEGVIGKPVHYAVSPFHQTPAYARAALADAGYKGCVGGIIRNDPDFVMARAGAPPSSPLDFIGHSQQCMLHGDCVLGGVDQLAGFKKAFDIAREGRAFFGYLDHPFSARYQYGWTTEEQRIHAHRDFISYIRHYSGVLFANESDALDFIGYAARIEVSTCGVQFKIDAPVGQVALWPVAVEYRGVSHALSSDGLVL